jgi:hypothetical protein
MLSFWREESKVVVHVQHGIFDNNVGFSLNIESGQPYQAELLLRALRDNLEKRLIDIKKQAYEEGWKDAKAKKKKQIYFWGSWKS